MKVGVLCLVWLAALCGVRNVPAQLVWQRLRPDQPPVRDLACMAFDPLRGRAVLFGGWQSNDTWTWDGTAWSDQSGVVRPPGGLLAAIAFDGVRGRTVRFGGENLTSVVQPTHAQLWEWDGTSWTQRAPAMSPPARFGHGMATDPSGRVVMFGGSDRIATIFGDTWIWDGTVWQQQFPANSPAPRSRPMMAFDPVRSRVVLYGGGDMTQTFGDTWEWDGTSWYAMPTPLAPPVRGDAGMAWDPATREVLLFGGAVAQNQHLSDTWTWNGARWQLRVPPTAPSPRRHALLTSDAPRGRIWLWSGSTDFTYGSCIGDLWSWDGSSWTQVQSQSAPSTRITSALAYDDVRARTVLFSGTWDSQPDVWEWDGTVWQRRISATPSAPGRFNHRMAYDPGRQRVVVFGGSMDPATWAWDGTSWALAAATGPSPRGQHTMSTDPTAPGSGILLFGGWRGNPFPFLGDTWRWDGTAWQQLSPAHAPSERIQAAMAADQARGRVVLFGGSAGSSAGPWAMSDTWEWDGTDWLLRSPRTVPWARWQHAMVYDSARARVVMYGGRGNGSGQTFNDLWEWDGTDWTSRGTAVGPAGCGMAFDRRRQRIVAVGGTETWEVFSAAPAAYRALGPGCRGSLGVPALVPVAGALPWLGDQIQLVASPAPTLGALLLVGSSATSWNGQPLPLDLTPLGMTGCFLRVRPTLGLWAPTLALWSLALPADPALAGSSVFVQSLLLDPGSNPSGAVLSSGSELVLGSR